MAVVKQKAGDGRLTIAHDIPVSKGGNTTRANVFCLCQSHNSRMYQNTLAQELKQLLFTVFR